MYIVFVYFNHHSHGHDTKVSESRATPSFEGEHFFTLGAYVMTAMSSPPKAFLGTHTTSSLRPLTIVG